MLSRILIATTLIASAFIATGCQQTKRDYVLASLTTYDLQGKYVQSWSSKCEEHKHACNPNSIRNARTLYMGDDTDYLCGLDGKLHMVKRTYRTSVSIPVEGITCQFVVLKATE